MLDTPWITEVPAQLSAAIHLTISRDEIRRVIDPALHELIDAVESQGLTPTGPWFTHHFSIDPEIFDFEVCLPLATKIAPTGRVRPSELPASKVARTIYYGGLSGLPAAWREFNDWIAERGLTAAADLWECHVSKGRTELNRPLT